MALKVTLSSSSWPLALEQASPGCQHHGVPGISLSAGDEFSKGLSDALKFVAGLAWAAAKGLGFDDSGYIE